MSATERQQASRLDSHQAAGQQQRSTQVTHMLERYRDPRRFILHPITIHINIKPLSWVQAEYEGKTAVDGFLTQRPN
jgi:hypothetical protein